MIKKIGKILLGISLLSIFSIDNVNAAEEHLLSELILGENNSNVITTAPNFSTTSTDKGLFVQEGDATKSVEGKPTYYYRGAVTNNYVSFAEQIWRIVRVNEDSSVRLISENNITTGNIVWNSSDNANYINNYGTNNESNSDIKETVETWYIENIGNVSSYDDKVMTSSFCNDITNNYSASYTRLSAPTPTPIFICPNGAIVANEKVGLITADEMVYAGAMAYETVSNNTTYLSNNDLFWTISPTSTGAAFFWQNGGLYSDFGVSYDDNAGTRVVINLSPDVIVSGGSGTEGDPYVISDNLYVEKTPEVDNNESTENSINVKIDSNSKKDKIDEIVKDNPTTYFEVEENSTLPGKVTINVSGKYNDGSKLWLYKYNKDTNKIEYVKNEIEVKNGVVTINIDKAGEYFLTLNEIDSSILSEQLGTNLVFVIIFLSTILIGGTYALIYTHKLQKNKI